MSTRPGAVSPSPPTREAWRSRVLLLAHAGGTPVDLVIAGPGLEQDFLQRARRIELLSGLERILTAAGRTP